MEVLELGRVMLSSPLSYRIASYQCGVDDYRVVLTTKSTGVGMTLSAYGPGIPTEMRYKLGLDL